MKKSCLSALLLLLALTACGANPSSDAQPVSSQPSPVSASESEPQAMTLRPTDLSQESRTLLSIFGSDLNYFDYAVDAHTQALSLDLWCFDGTEWTPGQRGFAPPPSRTTSTSQSSGQTADVISTWSEHIRYNLPPWKVP